MLTGGGEADLKRKTLTLALRRNDFEWAKAIYSEKWRMSIWFVYRVISKKAPMSQLFISKSRPKIWTQFKDAYKRSLRIFKSSVGTFLFVYRGLFSRVGATVVSAYMVEKELDFQNVRYV